MPRAVFIVIDLEAGREMRRLVATGERTGRRTRIARATVAGVRIFAGLRARPIGMVLANPLGAGASLWPSTLTLAILSSTPFQSAAITFGASEARGSDVSVEDQPFPAAALAADPALSPQQIPASSRSNTSMTSR